MKKTFDCVKMKDEAQLSRAQDLEGLSSEERLRHLDRAQHALLERQAQLRRSAGCTPTGHENDEVTHILDEIARQVAIRK